MGIFAAFTKFNFFLIKFFFFAHLLNYLYVLQHPIGGRVTVIVSNLPNCGPGSLKYRDVAPSSIKMVGF